MTVWCELYRMTEKGRNKTMKQIGYRLFALLYSVTQFFGKRSKRVVLFNGQNRGLTGNLQLIAQELQRRDEKIQIITYSKADLLHPADAGIAKKMKGILCFFFKLPVQMAGAKQIFLNDNFIPLAFVHPKDQQIVQVWHGAGAFKRFGLSSEQDPTVRSLVEAANRRVTHLFVTSKQVIPYYQEAFGIPQERIYATGVPVIDAYFDEEDQKKRRNKVLAAYPQLKGKKVLLFAPTFRQTPEENEQLIAQFDVEKIQKKLGKDWMLLIKMHPKFPAENIPSNENCINMTDYSDITDLYMVADCLVTDYSSTVVEYVLLDKPIFFFAYDLEKYDRGFYRDYRETVPGEIAYSTEELLEQLAKNPENHAKRQTFVKLQYDYVQGGALERIFAVLDRS